MKHPSQWKEAETLDVDLVEARELLHAAVNRLTIEELNWKSVDDLKQMLQVANDIETLIECHLARLDN